MRILSRAVFWEISSSALLGTALFTFVLFMYRLNTGKLFEPILKGSASGATVAYLLALLMPMVLIYSLPIGTLVGVLTGLGRMSSDGEIVAMRAAGIPSRRVFAPVFFYSFLAMAAAGACSLYLTPFANREIARLSNQSAVQQLTAEIQPRVFEEQFTNSNTILYVGDVKATASTIAEWRNVFLADVTPPEQRSKGNEDLGDAPPITVASEALAVPDPARNSIQLSMKGVFSYRSGKDPKQHINTYAPQQDQVLQTKPREETSASTPASKSTKSLLEETNKPVEARIELHQRFALPFACLLLAMVGIPLGVSSRKSGRSGAFVVTVFLAFLYYMSFVSLVGLARQGRLSAEAAVWTPDVAFAIFGLILLLRLEAAGDRGLLETIRTFWGNRIAVIRALIVSGMKQSSRVRSIPRIPLLPGVVDTYVVSSFLFWFSVVLGSSVLLTHVFTFFELLGDIFSRKIPFTEVAAYHLFLTPKLLYDFTPISVLAGVLVSFGILAKNNEITAMKACGVSLYRLSAPVVAASIVISGGLFAFDHYYIPEANRIQDGIRNKIKGRPPQTYLRPDRKWIFGQGSRIYYYRYYEQTQNLMLGVNVFELDPSSFRLTRQISAERARWEPSMEKWIFQNGWYQDFEGYRPKKFEEFPATTFSNLTESPSWFLVDLKQEKQLNFLDLDRYIEKLKQSGIDTLRLRVQFHKKFSVPAVALVMALLSVPFAFLTGSRGAMTGVGVSFGIAIAYFAVGKLFEEIGNVNQLPAAMAAWAPDALFSMAGLYLFTRMRT